MVDSLTREIEWISRDKARREKIKQQVALVPPFLSICCRTSTLKEVLSNSACMHLTTRSNAFLISHWANILRRASKHIKTSCICCISSKWFWNLKMSSFRLTSPRWISSQTWMLFLMAQFKCWTVPQKKIRFLQLTQKRPLSSIPTKFILGLNWTLRDAPIPSKISIDSKLKTSKIHLLRMFPKVSVGCLW